MDSWDMSTAGAVYYECMAVIRRHSNAYDYAMERVDHTTAHQMIWELQSAAGWYAMSGIDADNVLTAAVDPDYGEWKPFPEAAEIAAEAAEYTAEQWDASDDGATGLALQHFERFARERGIELEARDADDQR